MKDNKELDGILAALGIDVDEVGTKPDPKKKADKDTKAEPNYKKIMGSTITQMTKMAHSTNPDSVAVFIKIMGAMVHHLNKLLKHEIYEKEFRSAVEKTREYLADAETKLENKEDPEDPLDPNIEKSLDELVDEFQKTPEPIEEKA
jgi:hypothetical protein